MDSKAGNRMRMRRVCEVFHVRARHKTKDDPTLVLGSDHGARKLALA